MSAEENLLREIFSAPGHRPSDKVEPYWDDAIKSTVVQENEEWIVSVTPMIFNDRIYLTHRSEYPRSATAGFCYDKGGAAMLAAMAWDFENEREPAGHKKVAFDARS